MNTSVNNTQSNSTAVNNKIQDFGQKIGGARKDWYQSMREQAERFAGVTVENLIAANFSKVVTLPNLEKMAEAGALSHDAARAILTNWRSIPTRCASSSYRLRRWAESVAPVCVRIGALLAGAELTEEERKAGDFRVLTAANWPAVPFSFGLCTVKVYGGNMYGYSSTPAGSLRVVHGGYYEGGATTDPAQIVATIKAVNDRDAAKRAQGCKLCVCYNRAGEYFVTPEHKTEIILFKGTREECYKQIAENADTLRERLAALRTFPELRRDWNRPRVGTDWRGGKDVSPELFAAALPFRGVEFGNWLNQTERAALLNSAFDGFHDLAQMLGISADCVTLGGSLAFAFASRGISKAAAHFEPCKNVINLTKKNGAGCMAHEWFHACDHHAATLAGQLPTMAATADRLGTEAGRAGLAIIAEIKKTDYYTRSCNLAKYMGEYWVKPVELAARGFEAVAAFLLNASGVCSDFLVNCISMDEFTAKDAEHRGSYYPYPTATEAAALAPYYLEFFRALFGADPVLGEPVRVAMEKAQEEAKAEQQKAEEIRARRIAEREAERKAEAEKAAADRLARAIQYKAKAEQLAQMLKAEGVQGVITEAQPTNATAAGYLGGYVVAIFQHGERIEKTIFKYVKNGRLRKGFKVSGYKKTLEHTEATAREFVEGMGAQVWEQYGADLPDHFGACNLHGLNTWGSTRSAEEFAQMLAEARKEAAKEQPKAQPVKASAADDKAAKDAQTVAESGEVIAEREGVQLVSMSGGVAAVGNTYEVREAIKATGARWHGKAKQWQAKTPEAVAALRAWFAEGEQVQKLPTPSADAEAVAAPTETAPEQPENVATVEDAPAVSDAPTMEGTPTQSAPAQDAEGVPTFAPVEGVAGVEGLGAAATTNRPRMRQKLPPFVDGSTMGRQPENVARFRPNLSRIFAPRFFLKCHLSRRGAHPHNFPLKASKISQILAEEIGKTEMEFSEMDFSAGGRCIKGKKTFSGLPG